MILLLGKNGYVSKRFQDFFDYKKIEYKTFSFNDHKSPLILGNVIRDLRPDFVINCVGYTGNPNIEACENDKEECLYVNVSLAELVADLCKKYDVPLGFVSTGCIYQEQEATWWHEFKETDRPNFSFLYKNCSWYSGTKALGESLVNKTWEKTWIFRLRMPFNHISHEKNLITKYLKYPKIWNHPNSISNLDEFVSSCYIAMEQNIPYGIYNMTNPGSITAKQILDIGKKYNVTKPIYEYIEDLEEFKKMTSAPRSNCLLDTTNIRINDLPMSHIQDSVHRTLSNWNNTESCLFW